MAIEKMALVQIEGVLKRVNKTLMKCCESKCFHIISSNRTNDSRSGGFKSLKSKSPYEPLVNRCRAIANSLGIEIKTVDYDDIDFNVSVDFSNYFELIEKKLNEILDRKLTLESSLKEHSEALMLAERLSGFDVKFSEIFACDFIKIRFGRLPVESVPKLSYYSDRSFTYYRFAEDEKYAQILYIVPKDNSVEVDEIFNSLFFERTRIPDYFQGDADEAKTQMLKAVREENEALDAVNADIKALRLEIEGTFLKVASKLTALDQSYELRQNVSVYNNKFFISGYVPKRKLKEFTDSVTSVSDVEVREKPLDSEPNSSPPVLLRNCWLFRPFEMFVKMYGLPNYNCFDPTPYVAVTFMLIFGIMFGDVGQSAVLAIAGFLAYKFKKMDLGGIIGMVGLAGIVSGFIYGSVFGNEEILPELFHYTPMQPMENIMSLLIGTVCMGGIVIIFGMDLPEFYSTSPWCCSPRIYS